MASVFNRGKALDPGRFIRRSLIGMLILAFLVSNVRAYAQGVIQLPAPGERLALSQTFSPPLLKGIKVYRNDPFRFDFILDKGDAEATDAQVKADSTRLIKYFLASLTVPEKDLWVNLSPYEKDRIVPEAFGQTEMGRDLLAQDYILKQITASVLYPDEKAGKEFWDKVYAEALKRYGTTDVPVDTFNKVWIVPEKATVHENKDAAFVVESRLKVMLESDYVAMARADTRSAPTTQASDTSSAGADLVPARDEIAKNILREVIIPILEKEVNEGKNFAALRQVYNSLILATWYKRKLKDSILGQAYADKQKTAGIDIADKNEKEKIWARYVEAFSKGAFNFIKEEYDPATRSTIPRKYFSGGTDLAMAGVFVVTDNVMDFHELPSGQGMVIAARMAGMDGSMSPDQGILQEIMKLVDKVAHQLEGKNTFGNQRNKKSAGVWKELLIDALRSYPVGIARNALTVLNIYLDDEIPEASLFKGFDANMLDFLTNYSGKFHLVTTEAVEDLARDLRERMDAVKERTGKEPVVVEIAAGYGDLTYGLRKLMPTATLIATDGFFSEALRPGEILYDARTIQARGVKKLTTQEIEDGTFRAKLGIAQAVPVIVLASHLPREGGVDTSLFNQHNVDELIFITVYQAMWNRKGSGSEDIMANENVWQVGSRSLNPATWFSGLLSPLGRVVLKLETYTRKRNAAASEKGAVSGPKTVSTQFIEPRPVAIGSAGWLEMVLEMAERKEHKTLGELLDAMKAPVEYKFPKRKGWAHLPTWQELIDAPSVPAEGLLNLLTDYIGAGLPSLKYMEGILNKVNFSLDQARECVEILDRNVEGQRHVTTKAENREIRAHLYARLKEQYPDLDPGMTELASRGSDARRDGAARIDDIKPFLTGISDLDDRLGVPHYHSRWHREGGPGATLKDHLQQVLRAKQDILTNNFAGNAQDQDLISLVRASASMDNDGLDAMILLHDLGKKEVAFRSEHGDMGFQGHEEVSYRLLMENKVLYKGRPLSPKVKMAVRYHDMHWKVRYDQPGEFERTLDMMRQELNGSLEDFEKACEFLTAFSVLDVLGSLWEGDRRGDLGTVKMFYQHYLAWKQAQDRTQDKSDGTEDPSVIFGGGQFDKDHPLVRSGRIIGVEDYNNVGGSSLADHARKKGVKRIYFDLDLTVFRSMGYISSSQWFERAFKEFGLEQALWWWGKSGHEARQIENGFFFRLMDPGIPAMIKDLQARGIECVGLTARDNSKDELRTVEILNRFGIKMNDVIFASGASAKAQALDDYEKGHGTRPALFVEDSFLNLEKLLPVHAHVDAVYYKPANANEEDEWDFKAYLEKARTAMPNGFKFEYYFNAVVKILELKGITRETAYEQLHQIHEELLQLSDPKPAGYDKLIQVLEISKDGRSYLFHDDEARALREKGSKDSAMVKDPGGIDLTPARIDLKTRDAGEPVTFNTDPAMLERLQRASGVTPVIIGIHALDSLRDFMRIGE